MMDEVAGASMPIGVALVGMDERSTKRMTTIFKMVFKGRCEFAQGEEARLGIVDLDGDVNVWETFRHQYPSLPAIVMSENPKEIEGATYVAKPAKLDLLWNSIFNLVTGLPAEDKLDRQADSANVVSLAKNEGVATTKPESKKIGVSTAAGAMGAHINTENTGKRAALSRMRKDGAATHFNPNDYLLGRIVSSVKENAGRECVLHVQCWKDRRLILLPDQGKAFTDLTDSQLKNLGVAAINEDFIVEINSVYGAGKGEQSESEIDGLRPISIDYLIWDLALRTARGRIPEETPESGLLYLQSWPNFTRLPHTPHGMRIASLWVNNPRTLDDIAVNLDIELTDVYSFYSAAAMVGLASNASRKVDSLIAPKEVDKKKSLKRGLFASILRHISK